MRSVADAELQMNSVERVKFYSDVENEPYEGIILILHASAFKLSLKNKTIYTCLKAKRELICVTSDLCLSTLKTMFVLITCKC